MAVNSPVWTRLTLIMLDSSISLTLRFILHCADLLFIFCRGDVSQFGSLLPAEVDVERTYNSYCVVSMCSPVVRFLAASASFVKDSMLLSDQYKERKVGISKN